jgi:hypothetical protein
VALHQIRTDDINGDPEAITCVITVNGRGIEVDLAERSMTRLVKALEPFWAVGSENAYDIQRRGIGKKKASVPKSTENGAVVDPKAVRAWAASNGVEVPSRGRIPQDVQEQYLRAEPQ